MAKNTRKHKTTDLSLPVAHKEKILPKALPYNGNYATEKSFSFSFACFDRTHRLFNLGDDSRPDNIVSSSWFLSLMDCLKDVSNQQISDLKHSIHDLHPVEWDNANSNPPPHGEQLEYWQFRLTKSTGRVIGFVLDSVFYVVWLDPHHNLTDSVHYTKAKVHHAGKSDFERLERQNQILQKEIEELLEYKKLYDAE